MKRAGSDVYLMNDDELCEDYQQACWKDVNEQVPDISHVIARHISRYYSKTTLILNDKQIEHVCRRCVITNNNNYETITIHYRRLTTTVILKIQQSLF